MPRPLTPRGSAGVRGRGRRARLLARKAAAEYLGDTGGPLAGLSAFLEIGAVAQLGERVNGIHEVRGSIPLGSTNKSRKLATFPSFTALSVSPNLSPRLTPNTDGVAAPPGSRSRASMILEARSLSTYVHFK